MRVPAIASRIPSHDSILSATLKQYVFSRVLFVVMIPALALAILYTRSAYQGEIRNLGDSRWSAPPRRPAPRSGRRSGSARPCSTTSRTASRWAFAMATPRRRAVGRRSCTSTPSS